MKPPGIKMRILFAIHQYPPEPVLGLQRKVLELSTRLARRGHRVTVLTRQPTENVPRTETLTGGVKLIRVQAKPTPDFLWPLWPSLSYRWAIGPITELAPDQDSFLSFYPFSRWAKRANPRLVCLSLTGGTVRGASAFEKPNGNLTWKEKGYGKFIRLQLRHLEMDCFRNADAIIAETNVVEKQLKELYPLGQKRIMKIPSGVDLMRFCPADRKGKACTVLYVGRLDPIKNVSHLLRAFSLCRRDLGLSLLIVGDGTERVKLEQLSGQLGIRDRTTFTGQVENVERYYRQADIFVLPSLYEAQGNAALEAMSAGLPVLMLRPDNKIFWIASEEIIQEGENGFCSSVDSPGEMAGQIERLAGDRELLRRMGQSARKYVMEHSDWDNVVTQFEDLMHNV
jgi:glycosyltransferase involved in cell wall biosynthesis